MHDVVPAPPWLRVVGGIALASAAVGVVTGAFEAMDARGFQPSAVVGFGAAALSAVVGFCLLTARIVVRLDDRSVSLRFGFLWKIRIAIEDIVGVRRRSLAWSDVGGVGLRWTGDSTNLFFRSGDVVEIEVARRRRFYRVQCSDAARTARLLSEACGTVGSGARPRG